jgi:N-acylglucosamine-6-phosphate 2-epimerase
MNELIAKLSGGLIVSCRTENDDPFNTPELITKFALAAQMGGAVAIRAQGFENIKSIREQLDIPIIGIIEGRFENNWVCITPDFNDIDNIIDAGADIVALDVTPRKRPNGMDGIEFFEDIRNRYDIPLMADISTFEEGIRASEMGADIVATTLSGFTHYTEKSATNQPDYELVEQLFRGTKIPIVASGRIWNPQQAKEAILRGAFSVVVGSAITRPRDITKKFVEALNVKNNP